MPGKPLIFKAFRASLTLVPAGYIGAADAAFRRDLPLRERCAVAKAVAQGDDHPLPRRQHCVHDLVELPVGLPCAEILEQILIRAQHIHQRQRVPVLPGLNAVRKRNIPRRLLHRPEVHQDLIRYPLPTDT